MASVGIDLIEIDRIKKSMKNPRFLKVILGEDEYIQLKERGFPVQSVAASFAAKEAFSKAVGTGFTGGLKFCEIELLRKSNGAPYLKLSGAALKYQVVDKKIFSVSVTHTKLYAAAVVLAETSD